MAICMSQILYLFLEGKANVQHNRECLGKFTVCIFSPTQIILKQLDNTWPLIQRSSFDPVEEISDYDISDDCNS